MPVVFEEELMKGLSLLCFCFFLLWSDNNDDKKGSRIMILIKGGLEKGYR